MVAFFHAAPVVLLLISSLASIHAEQIPTKTAQYPMINSSQLPSNTNQYPRNTTFLASVTPAPALPELASAVKHGPLQPRGFRDQWPTSLGGSDCIEDHDDRCFCCKWRRPAKPAACGKLKYCPCINQICDPKNPKDPNCKL